MSLMDPDDAVDGGAPDDDATDLGNEGEIPEGEGGGQDNPLPTTPSPPD